MSDRESADDDLGPIGPMYITDFLDYLNKRNPNSRGAVLGMIQAARTYGVSVSKAEKIHDNVYLVRTHIGSGLEAIVEMERDRGGRLQPVFGEIVKP